ncbi:MAG: glycerophosphoryl diester phosphodiesterase membrane domain-containing protein [Caldilineaceae bacterium]|nr:glycerophosphoryl diester phosphodiesterase membrane domain-containing protein [Caldilineaceae bacterium]
MNNPLPIAGPLSLGDLLDRAFRLYRARFTPFLLTAAIILIPYSLISGLLSGRFLTGYMDAFGLLMESPDAVNEGMMADMLGGFGSMFGGFVVLGILGLVFNGVVTLALISQSTAALHEEQQPIGVSLRRGVSRFIPYAWMSIVQFFVIGLVTTVVLIPVFLLFGLIAFAGAAIGSAAFGDDGGIVGGIALVLVFVCGYIFALLFAAAPATYFSARWIGATPALMAEDLGAMEALGRSWRLTGGRIWRVIGYTVLLSIITAIVVSLPAALIQQVFLLAAPTLGFGLVTAASTAITSIFTVVWTPLSACAVVLLYYDLRVRSEGYDLNLRIQQMESQLAPRPPDTAQDDSDATPYA